MDEPRDFIDRIVEAFVSLRTRPHFEVLARQFAAGEVSFVVDRQGVQVRLNGDEGGGSGLDAGIG